MLVRGLSHARLMAESEARIEAAARFGEPAEQLVAERILGDTRTWYQWESEHARLLRDVAERRRPLEQDAALRNGAFSLIHRRALFEFLRERELRGEARKAIITFFHGSRTYARALVAEHAQYLRSAGSFICTRHIGSSLFNNGVFQQPLRRYEELYKEYFAAFCDAVLAQAGVVPAPAADAQRALLPLLKHQVAEQRRAIMALPRMTPSLLEDVRLREPTGDTVRLPRPF